MKAKQEEKEDEEEEEEEGMEGRREEEGPKIEGPIEFFHSNWQCEMSPAGAVKVAGRIPEFVSNCAEN